MSFHERRKAPRVEVDLPIILQGTEGEISGKTINISANGIYFEIPRFIEPMTKLRMGLAIPAAEGSGEKEGVVQFDGLVVRAEPDMETEGTDTYRIAVFFTHVPDASRDILTTFIDKYL